MDFQEEIEALKAQVKELVHQNELLQVRTLVAERNEAERLIDAIFEVIEHGDKLESDFLNLVDKIESDELLIDLAEVNNPSSEVLGFKFTNIILKAAHKHFIEDIPAADRTRFLDVITNTIQNPLVKALMATNPVSWLVSSIVDKAANFTQSVKGKPRERILSVKRAVGKDKLDAFAKDMERYFPFYEELLSAAEEYEESVNKLGEANQHLEAQLENYYDNFLAILSLDKNKRRPLIRQAQERFAPIIVNGLPSYEEILKDEQNQAAYKIAANFPRLKEKTQTLIAEYQVILSDYLENNLEALAIAKELTTDTDGLERLENRIQQRKEILAARVQAALER